MNRHHRTPGGRGPSTRELLAFLPVGRLWALAATVGRRRMRPPDRSRLVDEHHADTVALGHAHPAVLGARGRQLLDYATGVRAGWPTWARWVLAVLVAVVLGAWVGWLAVAVAAAAGLGLRLRWPRWDRLEHALAVGGLGLLLWALPLPWPQTITTAAGLAVAAWWLATPPPAEPVAEPNDPVVAGLFNAIRRIAGISPVTQAFRTETDSEYAARAGVGEQRTVTFEVPTNPADHVRVAYAADSDGTRRLDERGRPLIETVRVRLPDHFERAQRGDRLARQVGEYLGVRVLADWGGYNQPTFRRVPDLPTRVDHGAARALLPLVGRDELILGRTDPDAAFVRELAGQPWLVVDQRRHPNLLIVGRIGMGKSSVGRHVTALLLAQGAELLVADGKGGEFTYLAGRPGVLAVAHRPADILDLAAYAREELERRMHLVNAAAHRGQSRPQFRPLVLVTDEHKLIVDQLDPAAAADYNEALRYLAVGGRRDRVWSVHMLQRPAAGTSSDVGLPTLVRAQMSVKIGMGPQDKIGAEMIFEDTSLGAEIELLEGRAGVLIGRQFARTQFPWLANPAELEPASTERGEAERFLPPVTSRPTGRPVRPTATTDPDPATEETTPSVVDVGDVREDLEDVEPGTQAPTGASTHPVTTRLESPGAPRPVEPRRAPTTLGDTSGPDAEGKP
jgi:hypothetical protein